MTRARSAVMLVGLGLFAGGTVHYFLIGEGVPALLCLLGLLTVSAAHIYLED